MIANKDSLIYSLEKSINELEEIINNSIRENKPDSNEVYSKLGTALLWIGSCLDRLREINVEYSQVECDYVQAFRGAYDSQKHSVLLVRFDRFKRGGISFPTTFPLEIPASNYYFKKLEEDIINNKKEIRKYNKVLSNKAIVPEIIKIKQILISKLENY